MADAQANLGINLDASQALAQLKNLQRQISLFNAEISRGSASAAASASSMQRNLINSINATGQFSASMTKIRSSSETFTNALEKNKLSMGEYFKYSAAASGKFTQKFSAEFQTLNKVARERVKDLQTQYISMGRDANGALQSIKIRPLVLDMKDAATQTAIAAQKQQIFNQLLRQGSTNLLNFGKNTQWAGRQLMVGFTIPLAIAGSAAAKSFMQMEEQAIRFKRVYGELFTSESETNMMLKQIQSLALEFTKYGVSVEQTMSLAADAAAMGKMGADLTAQVSEATRLAVLGGVEQEKALETTISLTNAFGTSVEDLARKTDFLNAVENQTVVSIEDLTIAIPKAGPVVKQLGGDIEDLAFFLTAMKEGGINASEGANALKSGLASLINPTEQASSMLSGFGINIRGIVESNKGDINGIVISFAKALDQLDPTNRARAIEQLFGKFQFSRISTLFQNVIAEGTQAQRVLELTNATSAELASLSQSELGKLEQSPLYKFQAAVAEFQAALAPVGESFLKLVTPVIEFGTKLLDSFNNMSDGAKAFVTGLVAVLGAIGPVFLMTFGLLANGIANLIKGFASIGNVMQRLRGDSTSLGQQTEYLTQEQINAAAVGSSLDQTHVKLTQTFTSEKAAVDNLVSSYQRMVSAQRASLDIPAGAQIITGKGASKKGTPPQGFSKGRKVPGYANGVVQVPGPKGAGDIMPAMLAPGEAVIPADMADKYGPLINAMIAGKIPGYMSGKGTGEEFAHIGSMTQTTFKDLEAILRNLPEAFGTRLARVIQSGAQMFGESLRVNLYGGLGFTTGRTQSGESVNNLLGKPGGVSKTDFLADFDSRGIERWNKSVSSAGLKLDDVSSELSLLDKNIREYISSIDKNTSVTDDTVKKAYEFARKKMGAENKLIASFDALSKTATEARINISQKAAAAAGLQPAPTSGSKKSYMFGEDKVRSSERFSMPFKKAGIDLVEVARKSLNSGAKEALRIASPSKETRNVGRQAGQGYIEGAKEFVDDARAVGQQTGAGIVSGVSQSGRPIGPQNINSVIPNSQNVDNRTSQSMNNVGNKADIASQKIATMSGNAMQFGFVLTSIAGIGSMMGGTFGDISQKLFALGGAITSASFALQIFQSKAVQGLVEKVGSSFSNVFAGAAGGGIVSKVSSGAKGIGAALVSIGKGLPGWLKLVAVLGLVFLGMKKLFDFMDEQAIKSKGLANVTGIATDNLNKFASALGQQTRGSSGPLIQPMGTGAAPVTGQALSGAQAAIDAYGGEEVFKEEFKYAIDAISNSSKASAESALQALSMRLLLEGWSQESVQQLIDALKITSGRQDIQLEVNSISLVSKDGNIDLNSIKENAQRDAALYQQEYDKARAQIDELIPGATEQGVGPGTATFDVATAPILEPANEQITTNISNAVSVVQGLSSAFQSGTASAADLAAGIDAAFSEIPRTAEAAEDLKAQLVDMGSEAEDLEGISFDGLVELTKANQLGLDTTKIEEYNRALQSDSPQVRLRALRELRQANDNLATSVDAAKLTQELSDSSTANTTALEEQVRLKEEERLATDVLIALGYDEANAKTLAADSTIKAAIATAILEAANDGAAGSIDTIIEKLGEQIPLMEALASLSGIEKGPIAPRGGGSAKQTSFLDDIVKQVRDYVDLNQKVTEGWNESTAALSKFSGTARSGFRGLASQLRSVNVSEPLIEKILGMTPEEWKKQKNKLFEFDALGNITKLTQAGQAIQDALNTATIGQFVNEQENITVSVGNQITALERLTAAGASYEAAYRAVQNTALAAAIATAKSSEEIRAAANAAMQAQAMMNEMEAKSEEEQRKDNIRNAVKAINKEYSDQAKILDYINKNRSKLSEAQIGAILSNKELRSLVLEPNIDSKALKTALDNANKQADLELKIKKLTVEGQEDVFQTGLQAAMSAFSAQEQEIELNFKAKVADDNALVASAEDQIAKIEFELDDYQAALQEIDWAEQEINDSYEKRFEALDKIAEANDQIAASQAKQLDLADALSRGDIAAAARAAQDMRAQQQEDALATQRRMMESAQSAQIAMTRSSTGLTREELEAKILQLEKDRFGIEENTLEPAQERIRLAELQKQQMIDDLEVLGKTRDAWDAISNSVDLAQANGYKFAEAMKEALNIVETLISGYLNKPVEPPVVATSTKSSSSSGGSSPAKAAPAPPSPAPRPKDTSVSVSTPNSAKPTTTVVDKGSTQKSTSTVTVVANNSKLTNAQLASVIKADDRKAASLMAAAAASKASYNPLPSGIPKVIRSMGGMINKYATGGLAMGSDVVPSLLTPGEFVIRRPAVNGFGVKNLESINRGTYDGNSVYNYSLNVNVKSDANPNEIASTVMRSIRQVEGRRIRGNQL